jgi:hypothetical protein
LIDSACHQGKSLVKMASGLPCFCPTPHFRRSLPQERRCSIDEKSSNRFPKSAPDKAESIRGEQPMLFPYAVAE